MIKDSMTTYVKNTSKICIASNRPIPENERRDTQRAQHDGQTGTITARFHERTWYNPVRTARLHVHEEAQVGLMSMLCLEALQRENLAYGKDTRRVGYHGAGGEQGGVGADTKNSHTNNTYCHPGTGVPSHTPPPGMGIKLTVAPLAREEYGTHRTMYRFMACSRAEDPFVCLHMRHMATWFPCKSRPWNVRPSDCSSRGSTSASVGTR